MKLLTINLSGKPSAKEVRELNSELWDLIQARFPDYAKHRIIGDKSVTINLEPKKEEAWLKSRSYHE